MKINKKNTHSYLIFFGLSTFLNFLNQPLISQTIKAHFSQSTVNIDGKLNETAWKEASAISEFYQFQPQYGKKVSFPTIVKVIYNNKSIYFGFECSDPEPEKITAQITKRDGMVDKDDGIMIILDTFSDNNNGYLFSVNPLGTQKDGAIADNGRTIDFKWDETWYSECTIHEKGWTAEIEIPFESIKYDKNLKTWGFNAGRRIARNLEKSFTTKNLTAPNHISQFGKITDLDLKNISGKSYTLIPYFQSKFQKNTQPKIEMGGNVRYDLATNLSLEATLNPDFATVEADVEKVNLTRYEMEYAEKRPFFLEGAENYDTRIRQFYSRRIGKIPWGIKLTGKVNTWKVNGLITQSDPSTAGADVPSGEKGIYSVFRINRDFTNGSTIGIIGTNRNYREMNAGSIGLTATLFFTDEMGMTSQIIKTHGPAETGTWTGFIRPAYNTQYSHFHLRYSHYGEGIMENLNTTGLIRDDDRKEIDSKISHIFWINRYGIESLQPSINYNRYWSQKGRLRSYEGRYNFNLKFLKKWQYEFFYKKSHKAKYFPFFEKNFNNYLIENKLEYDNKKNISVVLGYCTGYNFDRDLEKISGEMNVKILKGWNITYHFDKHWFNPADQDDNTWIHYIRSSYYLNKDLYFKFFYQTRYRFLHEWTDPEFDLLRNTVQLLFVWRIFPPFGSLQVAYQEGNTRYSDEAGQDRTLFTKISWVF